MAIRKHIRSQLCAASPLIMSLAIGYGLYHFVIDNDGPVTADGHEKIGEEIPFAQLQSRGDPRIQHLITRMRAFPEGEDLYQYAANTNLQFTWFDDRSKKAGGLYENGTMQLFSHIGDDRALFILAHEIRHHWQDTQNQPPLMKFDPVERFQMAQLREIDACAYTAHFTASHHDAMQKRLDIDNWFRRSYGDDIADNYAQKSPAHRDYINDAFIPCANEIQQNKTYQTGHTRYVVNNTKELAGFSFRAESASDTTAIYGEYYTRLHDNTVAATIRHHFTTGLNAPTPIPQIRAMDDQTLRAWFNAQIPGARADDIQNAQHEHEEARRYLEQMMRPPRPNS